LSVAVYGSLADVYDFLVPEALLSPEGSAAAFATVTAELDDDLRATGFEPAASTWDPDVERYLVTSRANRSNASR
jgi:hypothetical protein